MDSSVNISLAEPEQTMPISILFECVKINVLASQGCQNGYKVKVSHFWIFNYFSEIIGHALMKLEEWPIRQERF